MRVGVEFTEFADAGELFADARALEGAGADSLWIAAGGPNDPWVLAAALAAVTTRARLVVLGADRRGTARASAARLSRGRLLTASSEGTAIALAPAEGEPERWERAPFPASKAAWRAFRDERAQAGVDGLVLANDPRLLDLLRNPDVDDDRSDLRLAYG